MIIDPEAYIMGPSWRVESSYPPAFLDEDMIQRVFQSELLVLSEAHATVNLELDWLCDALEREKALQIHTALF